MEGRTISRAYRTNPLQSRRFARLVHLPGCRLWAARGGGIFACRHCYQLAYASAREDVGDRAARRADRLRARIGWEPGILNGKGSKPKWMRWRTFDRLTAEHDQFVGRSMQAVALKFGLFGSDFRD